MTVLASLSSQSFGPQTRDLNFSVAAGATEIRVTFTHANTLTDWPAGPIVRVSAQWVGNGEVGEFQTSGGVTADKAGVPLPGPIPMSWSCRKPAGITAGNARVTVLQTFVSAIAVESLP